MYIVKIYTTVKVVSLVDPNNSNKHVIGTRKRLVIRNSETVALSGPTTIDLYRGTFGTRKSGRNLRMVVLSDRSLSGSLLYMQLKISKIKIHSREYTMRGTILKKRHQHFETIKDVKIGNYLTINWLPTVAFKSSIGRNKSTRKQLIN